MSTAVLTNPSLRRFELNSVANTALKAATRFWFAVTVLGQLAFAFAVASFYGMAAIRGDHHAWNGHITHGYVPGDTMGNLAVAMHLSSAVVIMLAGAVQLVPQVRSRFPMFHRWNGRIYMLTALALSAAGVYMHWVRGSVGDSAQHIGGTVNAVLIWFCGAMALRYAMARNFGAHRCWALRFFLVVSASWFLRIGLFLTLLVFKGPVGFDPSSFTGPFLTFMVYAQFLVPLGVLEIYLRAQDRPGAVRRLATAAMLFVVSLLMVAGLFAVTMAIWVPQVKAGFDPRKSIAESLSETIDTNSVDAAVKQYYELKTSSPKIYNFDETELNGLGYQLISAKKVKDAIRILQLNVEVYPQSSNVYDSLGEAYMDDGNKPLAIVNYQKSLQLNPRNHGAVVALQKLGAR